MKYFKPSLAETVTYSNIVRFCVAAGVNYKNYVEQIQ